MSDLRERLIQSDGFGDALSELRADRALAVFAAWLRERAEGYRELAQQRPVGPFTREAARSATHRRALLLALADEIERREASDGD